MEEIESVVTRAVAIATQIVQGEIAPYDGGEAFVQMQRELDALAEGLFLLSDHFRSGSACLSTERVRATDRCSCRPIPGALRHVDPRPQASFPNSMSP
jgi:hypothetical protein